MLPVDTSDVANGRQSGGKAVDLDELVSWTGSIAIVETDNSVGISYAEVVDPTASPPVKTEKKPCGKKLWDKLWFGYGNEHHGKHHEKEHEHHGKWSEDADKEEVQRRLEHLRHHLPIVILTSIFTLFLHAAMVIGIWECCIRKCLVKKTGYCALPPKDLEAVNDKKDLLPKYEE
ncbi:hypothetical protein SeMB42_g02588 [Synchytrium endobioticum]|nr:hypothetical protein SeMB42_g02588 [Synchytrium endobioticum]